MKQKLLVISRLLLGLIFFVFGLNGFFHFLPQPPMPPEAMNFAMALMATGYMFPLMKVVEVVAGLMLLSGMWVPLALVLLAANIVNIFFFHLFLAPSGLPVAIVVVVLEVFLAWNYRSAYRGILAKK